MDVCKADKTVIQDSLEMPLSRRSEAVKLTIMKDRWPCLTFTEQKMTTGVRNFIFSNFSILPITKELCVCVCVGTTLGGGGGGAQRKQIPPQFFF